MINRHAYPARINTDQGAAYSSHNFEKAVESSHMKHIMATVDNTQAGVQVNLTTTLDLAAYINQIHREDTL